MTRRLGQRPIDADISWLRVLLGKVGLAQPVGWLPFAAHQHLAYNQSASGESPFAVTIPRALTVMSWHIGVYVGGTNDGSNYWTMDLYKYDTSLTVIDTLDTSAISGSTHTVLSEGDLRASIASSYILLGIRTTKTGSPGNLYLYGPAVFAI